VREGLAGLLRGEPDFEDAGEASDGRTGLKLIRKLRPDVVLMDINMPGMDGIEATRLLHRDMPEVSVIGLSTFEESGPAAAIRKAGAVGYVTKSGGSQKLIEAIRACMPQPEKAPRVKSAAAAD